MIHPKDNYLLGIIEESPKEKDFKNYVKFQLNLLY